MMRRTQAEWRALFQAQTESGLTAAAFCREQGVCPKYFSVRRRQLMGESVPRSKRSVESAFMPVVLPGTVAMGTLEVRVGAEVQLRVPASVSAQWLAELLQRLRA